MEMYRAPCSNLYSCFDRKEHIWVPTKRLVDQRWLVMPGFGGQGVTEERDRLIHDWLNGMTCTKCRCWTTEKK